MLNLMKELGGVIIKKNYIFTEKLDWLEDIKTNILVNTGNPYAKPQYFAFLSLADGPEGKKENKKAEIDVDKYMIIFPGPKEYFLAGMPNGDYIRDLLAQYTYLVEHTTEIGQIMDQYRVQAGQLDRNNLNMAYTLASQIVVQRRQRELDERGEKFEGGFGRFAVDEYGLFTMNSFFFPDKMWFYFNNRLRYHDNFFNYAAKMPQDEFEESIGPLRYLANPDPYGEFNRRIEDARNGGKYEIVEGSFLQRHLFGDKPYAFVKPNRERRTSAAGKAWENLPKTLWLYWDSGSQAASASNQLCILNLIKNAKAAGYDVKEVNDNNANEYLPAETLNKIKNAISTANMPIRPQTKSDLYRLGLISTHGGIYLDSSYFFLEDFSWITYVSKEPSQLFYNRFGEVPKVLMQFHPI